MELQTFDVLDGVRPLQVVGYLLAESSSQESYKDRWVEFKLFRTKSDIFVVSRVGRSRLYHSADCSTKTKNSLRAVNVDELDKSLRPDPKCNPNWADPRGLFPETPRHWLVTCQTPRGVLQSVMKDDGDTEYFTNVVKRLLEQASLVDEDIRAEYFSEVID